jgi:hypothetical protein
MVEPAKKSKYPVLPTDIPTGTGSTMPYQGEYQGFPFRGSATPLLKETDPPSMQPKYSCTGHCGVFDMSNEEDAEYYGRLMNLAYAGKVMIARDEVNFDSTHGRYMTFVRWVVPYYYQPGVKNG